MLLTLCSSLIYGDSLYTGNQLSIHVYDGHVYNLYTGNQSSVHVLRLSCAQPTHRVLAIYWHYIYRYVVYDMYDCHVYNLHVGYWLFVGTTYTDI